MAWDEAYLCTKWHLNPSSRLATTWAENWGLCPFWEGRASFPSNTIWPGPRPTTILIHSTVWPQYTNVTDRQDKQTDRTDNGPIHMVNRFTNGRPKMAEPIEMPFGLWTRMGQRKHVLGGVHAGATWRIPLNCPCATEITLSTC